MSRVAISSGRDYASVYEGVQRRKHHEFIEHAVELSGGSIVASTGPSRVPLFLGVECEGERIGICAYVFLANSKKTRNRPQDE